MRHLVCIRLFKILFFLLFFFPFFIPFVFWVFWHLIYMWHGLSHSLLLFVSWFVFSLYCVHVFEFEARSMAPLSFGNFFFFFFFIYCVHAFEFRVRSVTPLFFGSFFFYLLAIFSFILLYCVHAYQNQCYMCTKISVIQWLASSGRLVMLV